MPARRHRDDQAGGGRQHSRRREGDRVAARDLRAVENEALQQHARARRYREVRHPERGRKERGDRERAEVGSHASERGEPTRLRLGRPRPAGEVPGEQQDERGHRQIPDEQERPGRSAETAEE